MKAKLTGIKAIIFDLGNVLLNLDVEAAIHAFRELASGAPELDYRQAYADPVFNELETGKITPAGFRRRVRQILNNPGITDAAIDNAWCAIIDDIPEHRVKTLRKLGKKYDVYLFSNTNPIHVEHLHNEFEAAFGIELPSLFIDHYYSYQLGERKPDVRSFEKVIQLSGINPEKTLFVDDLEENIAGAEKAGLQTFWLKKGMEFSEVFPAF